jgi:hypothetical protein
LVCEEKSYGHRHANRNNHHLLVIGAITGLLASTIIKGGGFDLVGDIIVGALGAFISAWAWSWSLPVQRSVPPYYFSP